MSEPQRLFAPGALPRLALRVAVAFGLLFWVIRIAIPESESGVAAALIATWESGPITAASWFAFSFGLFGVSFAVGASRFSMLLRGAGIHLAWWTLFRAYLVASFFNLALPGAILGDVY